MIEIQSLKDLTFEQVVDLLLDQKIQPFEIFVPKETQLFNSDRGAIALDYANLAYSGQLLFDIADEFQYEQISPDNHTSVLFTIKTRDIEKLASVLLHISYGYINDHPEDDEFNYSEESSYYFDEIKSGKVSKIACPYFIDISKEYKLEDK